MLDLRAIPVAILALGGCAASTLEERVETLAPPAVAPEAVPASGWREIGRSVEGRPIEAITVGSGSSRVLVIGSIHGNETESLGTMEALADLLARAPVTVRIIRDINPDGTLARRRTNARGVDLNRNFPASNFRASRSRGMSPLSEPEAAALAVEIELFEPDVVIVCHSTGRGPFVNFDGPAAALAGVFADAAAEADSRWRVLPDMGYPTPGSLGSFVGVDRGIPILTIEQDRGADPVVASEAVIMGVKAVVDHGSLRR